MTELIQLEMPGLPAPAPKKEPPPPKSRVVSIRLPMEVLYTLQRRIDGRRSRWMTIGEYLKERVIYDVERVHGGRKMDYQHGHKVKYIPNHAEGDPSHPDCQDGVVSSVNERFVFVKYDCLACTMVTGDEPYTAQATERENLIRRG